MKNLLKGFSAECINFFRSEEALIIMVVGVIFYSVLYPQSCITKTIEDVPVAVVDFDNSSLSRTFIQLIDESYATAVTERYTDSDDAFVSLREGHVAGVVVVPKGFAVSLMKTEAAQIGLYADASHLLNYRQVYTGARQTAELIGAAVRLQSLEKKGLPAENAMGLQNRGRAKINILFNPLGDYAANTLPPVLLIILCQTMFIGAAVLTAKLNAGLDTPVQKASSKTMAFRIGRLLFYVSAYSLWLVYYSYILPRVYDLPSPISFADAWIFLLPFMLAVPCAGFILGTFLHKAVHIFMAVFPTTMPILFLSGFTWPPASIPRPLLLISQFLPSTPAINGYMYITEQGASFSEVSDLWFQLWGLFFLFFGLSMLAGNLRRNTGNTSIQITPTGSA